MNDGLARELIDTLIEIRGIHQRIETHLKFIELHTGSIAAKTFLNNPEVEFDE